MKGKGDPFVARLKIYSKPRGAGDQTSGGRGKLLRATSNLTRVDVLVRETLQNAWDARVDGWFPAFGVDLHKPSVEAHQALVREVFAQIPASLHVLRESLADPEMRVMEIYDRGTSGLNGPYHANQAAGVDESNNFNSFVFDIGTTKSARGSGGTFGFGKTATFEVSHAHAVVYWSVCADGSGELEHRLIASSLHEPYDEAGARFTGAHWWGAYEGQDIIPLRGDAAQELGEKLFRTHFGDEETGTSILVIDPEVRLGSSDDSAAERVPVRTDEHENLLVDTVVAALAENAWPKATNAGAKYPPMIFHVYKGGEEIEVTERISESYRAFGASLTEVRKRLGQLDGPVQRSTLPVLKEATIDINLMPRYTATETRRDYFGDRADRLAGVLHLMIAADDAGPTDGQSAANSFEAKKNRLCFMRSTAELVVFYEDFADFDLGQVSWTGVFKPTPECDRHFASAEPPTHDAWSFNTAETEVSSFVVRRSLAAIKRKTREFLEAQQVEHKVSSRSVRDVAAALSSFVPLGHAPSDEASTPKRSNRARAARATTSEASINVTRHVAEPDGKGYTVHFVVIGPESADFRVTVRPSAQTSEGLMGLGPEECLVEWDRSSSALGDDRSAVFRGGAEGQLRVRTAAIVALELSFEAEEQA